MFKPALARGTIQCIGATTLAEYRNSNEKDVALERRFQKIIVEQTNEEETLEILKNIKDKYEDHHNVIYTPEALLACVKLTSRYMTDRYLPDKAIDALDEAGSRVHLTNLDVPQHINDLEKELEDIKDKKMEDTLKFDLKSAYDKWNTKQTNQTNQNVRIELTGDEVA